MLEQLGRVDRAIVLCGLDGLLRLGEILNLRRVDDHGELLHVVNPKNNRTRAVPISARLRAALDALPASDAPYIFEVRRRGATASIRRGTVAHALKRACAAAGVPYGRARHGLTFHWSTRRTGATRMIRKGGDGVMAVVKEIGGWETMDVLTDIYQEVTVEDMRRAVDLVDGQAATRAAVDAVAEAEAALRLAEEAMAVAQGRLEAARAADSHSTHTQATNVKKLA